MSTLNFIYILTYHTQIYKQEWQGYVRNPISIKKDRCNLFDGDKETNFQQYKWCLVSFEVRHGSNSCSGT